MAKEETAVSVAGQFDRSQVPVLLEKVKEQLTALQGASTAADTIGDKELPGVGKLSSLKKASDVVMAIGSVTKRNEAFKAGLKELKGEPLAKKVNSSSIFGGVAASTWIEALKARFAEIANEAQIKKLKNIQKELEQHLSEEQKFTNTMERLGGALDKFELD